MPPKLDICQSYCLENNYKQIGKDNINQKYQKKNNNQVINEKLSKDRLIDKININEMLNKLLVDTKLDEYFELIDEIKSGGGGSVFKGSFKKIKTKKFAALKMIFFKKNENYRKEGNHSQNSQKEYIEDHSEISIHYKLKNRYIPEVYGYYSIKDRGSA